MREFLDHRAEGPKVEQISNQERPSLARGDRMKDRASTSRVQCLCLTYSSVSERPWMNSGGVPAMRVPIQQL